MSVLATYIPDEVYTTTRNQILTRERPMLGLCMQWWPDQSNLIVVHCFVRVSTVIHTLAAWTGRNGKRNQLKLYTYKCVDRSRHNGIKGAEAKCAHSSLSTHI